MAAIEDRSGLGRLSALAGVTCWSMGNIMVARFDMPGLWIGFWRLTIGAVIYGLVLHLAFNRLPPQVVLGLLAVIVTTTRTFVS
jgi:drug/metabolite transporter (DMT)-like permease